MSDDNQQSDPVNIVTHARFTGRKEGEAAPAPFDVAHLRQVGLLSADVETLDAFNLNEPNYDEDVIGTLTADEAIIYASYHRAVQDQKKMEREIIGGATMEAGRLIAEAEDDAMLDPEQVLGEEKAAALYRAVRRADTLRAALYWQICERIGSHDWYLSVRSKGRIVRTKRKW